MAFGTDLREDFWLGYVIAALVQCGILLNVVAVGALIFIWLERKVSGRIQDRLGPTRVGGRFGWLQTLADGVKLLAKEDLTPDGADPMLFRMAPYVSFAAGFSAYLALPFSNTWVAWELNIALFFILAVLGIEVFGVILAGYASGSKWSLFGAMREAAQVVSYEVPLGLCAVIPVVVLGTMNLMTIGNMQAGLFTNWLVLHDPFTFCVFFIYFTCATASVNRAPFDLAEAESELVAGFHTEYSGLRWSFFFMAEYGSMFAVAGLAAILFFGGWNGPIPIFYWLGWATLDPSGIEFATAEWFRFQIANLFGCLNFILKAVIGVTVMMWTRWTLPRLRIDQVMATCLKYCTPLAAACFLGVVLWQMYVPLSLNDHYGNGWLQPFRHRSEVRERWVLASERELELREEASHERSRPSRAQIAEGKPASGPPAPVRRRLGAQELANDVRANHPAKQGGAE
ncbi:MAG: NADH-quinone oxidoreductase subunit NuoH [Planctomycetes bacterium]|nr:NADH-quinone oxidoreductase subunit NuoH [Planctomycetota bacterium]